MKDSADSAPFDTAKKERKGNAMTTQKHHSGTPFFVVYRRNFGALPSSARPIVLENSGISNDLKYRLTGS